MTAKKTPNPQEAVQKIMENKYYADQVRRFTNETFILILTDRTKAVELARKTVRELEPSSETDEYIELVADAMQELARKVMADRAQKTAKHTEKPIN